MILSDLPAWLANPHRPPLVMGILNVTPDSFSDGGNYASFDSALAHAEQMVAEGTDWIDVGAESTRPGSSRVGATEQIHRLTPLLDHLRKRIKCVISIDTTLSEVAEFALDKGADVVNDISAGRDDFRMFGLITRRRVPIVLMHMQGTPATMQLRPTYSDVVAEVRQSLINRINAAESSGIARDMILIDPGIGFGKTVEDNLRLLADLPTIAGIGRPVVVGASRKGFIRKLTGETVESGSPHGSAATVAWSILHGASIVRVHDVGPTCALVRMLEAIKTIAE